MTEIDVDIDIGAVYPVPVSSLFDTPPTGLTAAAVAGGGTFAAGTYYWVITGTDSYGETTASGEASAIIALNGSANLSWNPLPAGTTGVKVYRGTAPGAENALIATLGAVTAYTDTGTAGSGATPPTSNTAQIGDQTIYNGRSHLMGYSFKETSGTAAASLTIKTPGQNVVQLNLPQGTTANQWFGSPGIYMRGAVTVHVNSGVYTGDVFLRYYD